MLGLVNAVLGTFFREVATVIGKREFERHKESIYSMAALDYLGAAVVFVLLLVFGFDSFTFRAASLPIFLVRVVLEIVQTYATMNAIVHSDRSTTGFLMVGTLPLLLVIDLVLGYSITPMQIFGIGLIVLAFLILFYEREFSKKGIKYVLFACVNAAVTISLFKYNITHYNSVIAEQLMVSSILFATYFFLAHFVTREKPIDMLKKKVFMAQTISEGLGSIFASFAYLYGATSVITAIKRASSIFWATLSGNMYFGERHILVKLFMFLMLATGVVLIVI